MSELRKSAVIQTNSEDATLTIAAPGQGKYNCLTFLAVESSAAADVTVTSGSKSYKAAIAAGGGLVFDFDDKNPWVGAENTAITVTVSAGNYTVNARGFVHP